ncbi:MAG TPA: glycosyltransferase [Bacteroidia bacterium]|jgi:glycosyltransferase involved in cell wall biosynthesis
MQLPEITTALVIFAVYSFAYLVQLWFYLWVFIRLAFYKKKPCEGNTPPASIVICARNEDDNLVEFLPMVLDQDYPEYEVVVVNDCSFDNTGDVLEEFAKKHSRLKIVTIKEDEYYSHGKKFAVMVGIKGAAHEHLLFTDGDCKPNSRDWLRNMMCEMKGETEIVLGYGGYEKVKGLLNKIIRFDSFYIALQYLSFCLAGRTYMGVGRNLAYKKSLFFKMKGFASHYYIESGDDDLFVNEAATKRNSKIEIAVSSHTTSRVKRTFMSWIWQKRRHISTASFYNFATKWRLFWLTFSQWLFFASFVTLLCLNEQLYVVLGMFLLRMILQLLIFKKSMDKLGEKDLIFFTPLLEIALMFFYPVLVLSNLFLKKNKWKRT